MMSVKVLLALILVLNIYREQEHERLTEEKYRDDAGTE